jgi:hypothetical protein
VVVAASSVSVRNTDCAVRRGAQSWRQSDGDGPPLVTLTGNGSINEPSQNPSLVEDDSKRILDHVSRSTVNRVCFRPGALSKRQFHFCRRQQIDVLRPNDSVDRAPARLEAIARASEVNLSQPFPTTPIFMRTVREQQQVNI